MTEKDLKQYRSIIKEIHDLDRRIDQLYDKEIGAVSTKVKGSSRTYPYSEFRTSVVIDNPIEVAARDKLVASRRKKKEQLQNIALEIEKYVDDIEDSELRLIFKYRFIDGMKLNDIAEEVNLDRSVIGKKIRKYIDLPPMPRKPVL
jgi:uncharacterized protein Yka (UPF0111/DUF47 family)